MGRQTVQSVNQAVHDKKRWIDEEVNQSEQRDRERKKVHPCFDILPLSGLVIILDGVAAAMGL